MSNINQDYIIDYLNQVQPKAQGILEGLEDFAKENHVPIIQPEAAHFLKVLTLMHKPAKILEVGMAIGYSAILMSKYMKDGGMIHTIERNEQMIEAARSNIAKANLTERILIFEGDAKEILADLDEQYDMIFMDAAKGQYIHFLPHCLRLLRKGGLLISDNILYKGMVAENQLVEARKKTIVKRLRSFLKEIHEHPELESSIVPIGDGISLSYKI